MQAESHFKGLDLDSVWDCAALFAPDATTDEFKADLFREVQRGLPGVCATDGPLPAGSRAGTLRGAAGAVDGDPGLRAGAVLCARTRIWTGRTLARR